VSAAPVGDVCPGSNIVFNVSQTGSVVGALFNWVATDASSNVLGQAYNVPFATGINTNLGLSCPSNTVVTFTISPIGPSPYNCGGASVTRVVNVRDVVKPVWSQAANFFDRTVECNSAAVGIAQGLFPSATDNCDNDVSNIVKVSGAFVPNVGCPQSGTYTNTWTVTDDCGNVSLVYTQVITVTDLTAPLLIGVIPSGSINNNLCKANAPVPPTVAAIAALYQDNCGTVAVTLVTTNTGDDCAWSFTHTYTVKDNCGNTVAVSPVIVYSGGDKNAPTIGANVFPVGSANNDFCYNNVNVGPSVADIAALYSDNCGGAITVVKTNVKTGNDCAWTIVYTYSIKDKCGNEVLPQPTVTYTGGDKTPPSIGSNVFPVGSANNNFCFNNVNVGPTEAAIALLYADNCGGAITVVKTNVKTGNDCAWTIVYTYSIKDKCGNEVLPQPTITYSGGDKTAPSIGSNVFPVGSANNNFCFNNVNVGPSVADITALYADNCGGAITVVKTDVKTGNDCSWTIVYSYSIKDKCGNEVLPIPTVTYTGGDKTPPTLTGVLPLGATGINGCIGSAPVGPTAAAIAALYCYMQTIVVVQ
jgi:cytochrome c551/c552